MSGAGDVPPGLEGARHWGVALYDRENGHIAHIQRVTSLAGAPDLTPEQVIERAWVHARHAGHDTAHLKAAPLAADHDYRVPHIVDTRTGAVIQAPGAAAHRSPAT
jgi:hypothetical protein